MSSSNPIKQKMESMIEALEKHVRDRHAQSATVDRLPSVHELYRLHLQRVPVKKPSREDPAHKKDHREPLQDKNKPRQSSVADLDKRGMPGPVPAARSEEYEKLQLEIAGHKKAIVDLHEQIERHMQTKARMQQQLNAMSTLEDDIDRQRKNNEHLKNEVNQLKEAAQRLNKLAQSEAEDGEQELITQLREENQRLKDSERTFREKCASMEESRPEASPDTHDKVLHLEEESAVLKKAAEEYKEKLASLILSQENDSLDSKAKIAHLQDEIRLLRDSEKSLREKLARKETDVYELTSSTSEFLNKAMKDQESHLEEIAQQVSELITEKKVLNNELETMKKEHTPLIEELQNRQRQLEEVRKQKDAIHEKLISRDNEIADLRSQAGRTISPGPAGPAPAEEVSPAVQETPEKAEPESPESTGMVTKFVQWMKKPVIEVNKEEDIEE